MLAQELCQAINEHDLDAFVACFAADYRSEQPAHPARTFSGADQVRKNWSGIFQEVPDIRADLLNAGSADDSEWAEWRWYGTRTDGSRFEMRGMTLMGTREGHVVWARLYMEETEQAGANIDEAVQRLVGPAEGRP